MPTASNNNGNGSGPSAPPPPSRTTSETGPVQKGGPFDLAEMERLANEMFRAMPGALLPRIDPGQLESVRMNGERAAAHPPAEETPRPDHPSYVLDVPAPRAPASVPAPPTRSSPGGMFGLSGDPIPLASLGLAGLPRGATEDPFAASHYVIEEASRLSRGSERAPAGPALAASAEVAPAQAASAGAAAAQLASAAVAPAQAAAPAVPGHPGFDVNAVRAEFPVLAETVHGRPLVWLDNGATTQKPEAVIERLASFYRHENSNIHRGAHALAARATDAYEEARAITARFLNASSSEEIVFVRGTTEAINLVAQSWGRANVGPGDQVLITWLEHHANIVPWQQLCEATGARLCVAPVDDRGQVRRDEFERLLSERMRIVAFSHVSNALGTITPVREMTELAHRYGARVLVDGAQAVSHLPVDVQALDSDWYAFSGHKVFGPTGIGVLYGKRDLLDSMPPWQGGGNMIRDVTFEHTEYQPSPSRFEAGTGNIADAVGLGAALEYVQRIGRENIARHEHDLLAYATAALHTVPGLELIGTAPEKAAVLSFVLTGLSPEEVGAELDREGIAVRAGHHCAQPIVRRFGHEGTVRATLALYNTCEDVDALIAALRRIATRRVDLPGYVHS